MIDLTKLRRWEITILAECSVEEAEELTDRLNEVLAEPKFGGVIFSAKGTAKGDKTVVLDWP